MLRRVSVSAPPQTPAMSAYRTSAVLPLHSFTHLPALFCRFRTTRSLYLPLPPAAAAVPVLRFFFACCFAHTYTTTAGSCCYRFTWIYRNCAALCCKIAPRALVREEHCLFWYPVERCIPPAIMGLHTCCLLEQHLHLHTFCRATLLLPFTTALQFLRSACVSADACRSSCLPPAAAFMVLQHTHLPPAMPFCLLHFVTTCLYQLPFCFTHRAFYYFLLLLLPGTLYVLYYHTMPACLPAVALFCSTTGRSSLFCCGLHCSFHRGGYAYHHLPVVLPVHTYYFLPAHHCLIFLFLPAPAALPTSPTLPAWGSGRSATTTYVLPVLFTIPTCVILPIRCAC